MKAIRAPIVARAACWLWLAALYGTSALHAQSAPGTPLWSFDIGYTIVSSPALASDGTIYIGGSPGLFAITNNGSAASNTWVFFPGESLHGSAAVGSDGTIYFGGGNANFYAMNPDGSQKWKLPLQPEYTSKVVYSSTPAVGLDGTIYFVASGRLYAVTPGGVIKWEHVVDDTSSTSGYIAPVIGPGGTIYAYGIYNRTLTAVNPDGTEAWHIALRASYSDAPAIGPGGVIYIAGRCEVAPDGTKLWENTLAGSAEPIIGRDGTIYAANQDLALYSLTPYGGTNWSAAPFSVALLPTVPALDAGGMIYYCVSNALFAISPQGSVQWVFASPSPPIGGHMYDTQTSPVIGPDGTIYCAFGTKLFALAGTNGLADSPWPMYHQNSRHTGKVEKPSLNKPQKRSDGGFQFQLYGQLSNSYTVQTSTSLTSWSPLTSVLVTNVPMDVVDAQASNFLSRFYRVLSP